MKTAVMALWGLNWRKMLRWIGKSWRARSSTASIWPRQIPLGAQNVENPVSHVAYGYATQVCVLNDDGTIKEIDAAHFVGKAINPLNCEGQIEGGVAMALGFTLTEHYPLYDCIPNVKYGTLGLFRANQVPPINSILVEKKGQDMACGAIGIGEITTIPSSCRGRRLLCAGWRNAL